MQDNSSKIILDLCSGTGAGSKPYKEAGYTVNLITLPTYDVTRVEFGSHAMHFKQMDIIHYHKSRTLLYRDVYGILAWPPCTEFSLAKGSRPRDLESALKIIDACLKIIWHCRLSGNMKFWVMENPVGLLRQFMGKPAFTFEQWQFGDDGIKPTDLWGYFRDPVPTVKERPKNLLLGDFQLVEGGQK